jgi:hypothetical protein
MERKSSLRIPIAVRRKIREFADSVEQSFAFLKQLSYDGPKVSTLESEVLPYWTEAEYRSSAARRSVCIDLIPALKDGRKPSRDAVSLAIWRLGRGDDAVEDQLVFDLYLKEHCPTFDLRRLEIGGGRSAFKARLESVLETYATLLKREVPDILSGDRWEEGFFHSWV